MPNLKFTVRGVEFQYEGSTEEIIAFVNRFLSATELNMSMDNRVTENRDSSIKRNQKTTSNEQTEPLVLKDLPLPPNNDVLEYVTSQPQFTHDLAGIQMKFFGKTFSSRGTEARMYHKTARQVRTIREGIEKAYNGKFKEESAGRRNLKRFIFVKTTTTIPMFNPT